MAKHENRAPLPVGSVIEFCDEQATVVSDTGGNSLMVNVDGQVMKWYWQFEGASCRVISRPDGVAAAEINVAAP